MVTITRKIQLLFNCEKEQLKDLYKTWYTYQRICQRAANMVSTSHYVQENIKDFFFFEDGIKRKLGDIKKDDLGMLTMSASNTTYQTLSKAFKGDAPMGMMSGLNMVITQTYKKEAVDVKNGKKSLRSYRDNIPMPVRKGDTSGWNKLEDGNYTFFVYGTPFKTRFGRDLSGNEIIMDECLQTGNYKLCDSSIMIDGNKMFLLAVVQIPEQKTALKPDKELIAELSPEVPISFKVGKNTYTIGGKEEFLHRRLQIKEGLRRAQISSRFNKGGKGRKKKMAAVDRYEKAEKNYITTRLHQYSSKLVDWCVKMKCGKLVLANQIEKEDAVKDDKLLLASWSYYGLKQMLEYKCKKFGIELQVL